MIKFLFTWFVCYCIWTFNDGFIHWAIWPAFTVWLCWKFLVGVLL